MEINGGKKMGRREKELGRDVMVLVLERIWGLGLNELRKRTRRREYVFPRQLGVWYMQRYLGFMPEESGRYFGLSRCSALHSYKKIEDYLFIKDRELYPKIQLFLGVINNIGSEKMEGVLDGNGVDTRISISGIDYTINITKRGVIALVGGDGYVIGGDGMTIGTMLDEIGRILHLNNK